VSIDSEGIGDRLRTRATDEQHPEPSIALGRSFALRMSYDLRGVAASDEHRERE
jgi:hypothetical protein